jgi:hypothetical protein
MLQKKCLNCPTIIYKKSKWSYKQWENKKYCSNKCTAKSNNFIYKKGLEPWNKNTKGIMKANQTTFTKQDPRIFGKKQTQEHIENALKGRGVTEESRFFTKQKLYDYRYFYSLKIKFNITKEDYENMLSIQNNVCAICKRPNKQKRRLCVDHDHETGKIRGLLCVDCNVALGNVNESKEILMTMINYLEA